MEIVSSNPGRPRLTIRRFGGMVASVDDDPGSHSPFCLLQDRFWNRNLLILQRTRSHSGSYGNLGRALITRALADLQISLSHQFTEASRAVDNRTNIPPIDLSCELLVLIGWNQLAPFPARAVRFPVSTISRPHDTAFQTELESLGSAVAETSSNAQQVSANCNGAIFCVESIRCDSSEVFASEKQANAVDIIQIIEEQSMYLRR